MKNQPSNSSSFNELIIGELVIVDMSEATADSDLYPTQEVVEPVRLNESQTLAISESPQPAEFPPSADDGIAVRTPADTARLYTEDQLVETFQLLKTYVDKGLERQAMATAEQEEIIQDLRADLEEEQTSIDQLVEELDEERGRIDELREEMADQQELVLRDLREELLAEHSGAIEELRQEIATEQDRALNELREEIAAQQTQIRLLMSMVSHTATTC